MGQWTVVLVALEVFWSVGLISKTSRVIVRVAIGLSMSKRFGTGVVAIAQMSRNIVSRQCGVTFSKP
jgi:ABC-type Mn2+/Zn2+ transport system permease subunit